MTECAKSCSAKKVPGPLFKLIDIFISLFMLFSHMHSVSERPLFYIRLEVKPVCVAIQLNGNFTSSNI